MTNDINSLFQPLKVGNITLRNRIAMAPMTRHRSTADGVPTQQNVEHYRQRASAGLIVTEGTYPSDMGKGYLFIPGLCNDAHVKGWRKVTDAVHEEGGAIFCQLMHNGRLSDPLILPNQADPIAPSAVQPEPTARHYTINCPRPKRGDPYPTPREMTVQDIQQTIKDYQDATRRAVDAGFDGVELHAASGYLPHQFLSTNVNLRTDDYGGSVEKRARFLLDTVDAMIKVKGPEFVAVKISPGWTFHNVLDTDPVATFTYVTKELSKRKIAYLQVGNYGMEWDVYGTLRPLFDGPFMVVAGFTRATAAAMVTAGGADLVAFGQAFISNPDLAQRYRNGWPINRLDYDTFYTQGAEGYSDYPAYSDSADMQSMLPSDSAPLPVLETGNT
jgi:N-ethylmaleimide reductase